MQTEHKKVSQQTDVVITGSFSECSLFSGSVPFWLKSFHHMRMFAVLCVVLAVGSGAEEACCVKP